jgi:hypothetical protein
LSPLPTATFIVVTDSVPRVEQGSHYQPRQHPVQCRSESTLPDSDSHSLSPHERRSGVAPRRRRFCLTTWRQAAGAHRPSVRLQRHVVRRHHLLIDGPGRRRVRNQRLRCRTIVLGMRKVLGPIVEVHVAGPRLTIEIAGRAAIATCDRPRRARRPCRAGPSRT